MESFGKHPTIIYLVQDVQYVQKAIWKAKSDIFYLKIKLFLNKKKGLIGYDINIKCFLISFCQIIALLLNVKEVNISSQHDCLVEKIFTN